ARHQSIVDGSLLRGRTAVDLSNLCTTGLIQFQSKAKHSELGSPGNFYSRSEESDIYPRLGRYICVLVPRKTSADSINVSDSVGWGRILKATSLASAPISIASTPSAISSPAPAPTMPTPSTRSVF